MREGSVKIIGWLKNSFIDFPGTVSTVLFLAGCNLRCGFCHNPSIVRDALPVIDPEAVMSFLDSKKGLIDGVVISGGEPTVHAGLPRFTHELHKRGVLVKLDTNGLMPTVIEECSIDYLAVDVKTVPERYGELGCTYNDVETRLEESIGIVKKMGKRAEIRIPVVPEFVNDAVIAEFGSMLSGVEQVWLQPFLNNTELLDQSRTWRAPFTGDKLRSFQTLLAPFVQSCGIRRMP